MSLQVVRAVPTEPRIVINGITLTEAQAMTVRVAVGNFSIEVADPEYRTALGTVGDDYQRRLNEVAAIMASR